MPEGPEIRSAADKIAKVLEDKVAPEVFFGLPDLQRFEADLQGQIVAKIETRG